MADVKHAADSLKYQWRLYGLVARAKWATSLDKAVAYEIVDRYYSKFGNARASLSYLQEATGSDRKAIIASTRRLVEHGPFTVLRQGAGTRPTEYGLNFDLVSENPSGGPQATANDNNPSSGLWATTASGPQTTTNSSSSGPQTTQTVLPVTGLQAELLERMIEECATPTAPPADALAGTAAVSAQGGFEELWKTYFPFKGQGSKASARDAYNKLAPAPEQHNAIVAAAGEWFAAWAAQDDATRPRKHLHVWLREENYECEPPTAYRPKERKVKPKAPPKKVYTVDDFPDVSPKKKMVLDVGPFSPIGTFDATITNSDVTEIESNGLKVELFLDVVNVGSSHPIEVKHTFFVRHKDTEVQTRGTDFLNVLTEIAGLGQIEDSLELHGTDLKCTIDEQFAISYAKAA